LLGVGEPDLGVAAHRPFDSNLVETAILVVGWAASQTRVRIVVDVVPGKWW
jgi:hypothetical protein